MDENLGPEVKMLNILSIACKECGRSISNGEKCTFIGPAISKGDGFICSLCRVKRITVIIR